jgi:membrane-bound ClpP family serine protease
MGVDIRLPIGGMFAILGALLVIYGLFTNGDPMYARSLGINVNIWWGLAQLVFGVLMLFFGMRSKPRQPATEDK